MKAGKYKPALRNIKKEHQNQNVHDQILKVLNSCLINDGGFNLKKVS